jgi:hypothetical protein
MRFSKTVEDLVADFRGLPRTVTASSLRDPVPLQNILKVLEERYKLEQPSPERSLVEHWEDIFGPGLAARCHPVRIKDDGATLVVSVANPTLRSELGFRKRGILRKIRALEHCADIRDIVTRG